MVGQLVYTSTQHLPLGWLAACSLILLQPNQYTFHLISSHLISSHLISSHLISSHLISSHLISSHLISSRPVSTLDAMCPSLQLFNQPVCALSPLFGPSSLSYLIIQPVIPWPSASTHAAFHDYFRHSSTTARSWGLFLETASHSLIHTYPPTTLSHPHSSHFWNKSQQYSFDEPLPSPSFNTIL